MPLDERDANLLVRQNYAIHLSVDNAFGFGEKPREQWHPRAKLLAAFAEEEDRRRRTRRSDESSAAEAKQMTVEEPGTTRQGFSDVRRT